MKGRIASMMLLLAASTSLQAAEPRVSSLGLEYLKTEDLTLLYFDPTLTYLAPHATRSFHNSLEFQREVFGWEPWEPTTVLLKDFSDYGNAAARADPNNALMFDIAPLSRSFETYPASERMYSLMNHELVHVVTMDMWNEQDAGWRDLFRGKVSPQGKHPETLLYSYLTNPRTTVPRWYLEGSAVFMETWMGGGLGRAQGAYDEMVFRSMVRDGARFYDPLGLVSEGTRVDFQVGVNAYLYGTRFMTFLAHQHSPEQVVSWLKRDADSERYYADNFRRVFGAELEDEWARWIEFEKDFQRRNLKEVRHFPVTEAEPLVDRALGSVSRAYLDGGDLIGGFRYPGVVAHIGALDLDSGDVDRLVDLKGPMLYRVTALAFDPDRRRAFYSADNYALRDLMSLDLNTGKETMLMRDARIGELTFDPGSDALWGVRHLNGLVTLVRMPDPYDSWSQVHTLPYGEILYDMDISPDGTLLSASMGEVDGDQFLRVFRIADLMEGRFEAIAEFDFGQAVPEGFVFSPDGRFLYGSSYYTGVSNIFRFEVATGDVEAVSNAETGFFRPVPMEDGRLIVFEYTGDGFRPGVIDPVPLESVSAIGFLGAEVAERHPVVTTWQVGSPAAVDLEALQPETGPYSPLRSLELQNAYPVIEGYKDSIALGYHFNIEDQFAFGSLGITASYSPDQDLPSEERSHLEMQYRYINWTVGLKYNDADFYDLFGPTKRARKGYSLSVGYDRALIYDRPRTLNLNSSITFYDDLDTLPDAQNVGATFERFTNLQVGLDYSHQRHSLGHVDEEKGFRWDLVAEANHVNGETIPKLRGSFDFGFALPLDHSSIWFRNAAGWADGARTDPFANYFFGGFGNNYVDDGAIKRYRKHYAMPGFELNQLGGRTFARHMLEWNLPPAVFEKVGSPGFYLTWARPALFASVLTTDVRDDAFRQSYQSLGAQVDLRFIVMHRLDMTLSFGYAQSYLDGDRFDEEWMLSLKIL